MSSRRVSGINSSRARRARALARLGMSTYDPVLRAWLPAPLLSPEEQLEADLAPLVYAREDEHRFAMRDLARLRAMRENVMTYGHIGGPEVWRGGAMRMRVRRDPYTPEMYRRLRRMYRRF